MANFIEITPTKTYATIENAHKAVEKKYPTQGSELRYMVLTHTDGRFYPVFLGITALNHGVHFNGFNIIA
jgi:hypothetical protein